MHNIIIQSKTKKEIVIISFYITLILLIIFLSFILNYINYPCPWKHILNIYCAGCGTTRMFKSLINLDFYQAFRYNEFMFMLLPIIIIYLIINTFRYIQNKELIKPSVKIIILIIVLGLIFMILRNIPAFSFLQPTKI